MGRAEQNWNSNTPREVDIPNNEATEKSSYHKESDTYSVKLRPKKEKTCIVTTKRDAITRGREGARRGGEIEKRNKKTKTKQ